MELTRVLTASPRWWTESWNLNDWFQTFFNQPLEVHTFILGALVGVLLGTITIRCRPKTATVFAIGVILFVFGAAHSEVICKPSYYGCLHIRLKPWYFLAGFVISHILTLGAMEPVSRAKMRDEQNRVSSVTVPLGVLFLGVLGLAFSSGVSSQPSETLVALATAGGLFGSVASVFSFHSVSAGDRFTPSVITAVRKISFGDIDKLVHIFTYGAIIGFSFPYVVRGIKAMAGFEGFTAGFNTHLLITLLSVEAYALVTSLLSLSVVAAYYRNHGDKTLDQKHLIATALGNLSYTLCLFGPVAIIVFQIGAYLGF